MTSKQISPADVFQSICQKLASGTYQYGMLLLAIWTLYFLVNPLNQQPLTHRTATCEACTSAVFRDLVNTFRMQDVGNDELPQWAQARGNCWYGFECRTQFHNQDHARRFNHMCPNLKK